MKKQDNLRKVFFTVARTLTVWIFSFIELLLLFRFIFRILGANADNVIVNWVYETSYPPLSQFAGIFPNVDLAGPLVFETNTLFAMLGYMLLYFAVLELISFFHRLYLRATDDVEDQTK
jgi:hypothetical protein